MVSLTLTWDPAEGRTNERKHGVSFVGAQTAFLDERARLLDDPEHSAEETGIAYQTLINSYLRECAESKRRPTVRWAGRSKGAA